MELKFNSQICTTIEQSKKLLELGLKPETADMYITNMSNKGINYTDDYQIGSISFEKVMSFWKEKGLKLENTAWEIIPAWSLHRLFDIMYVHCYELKACENVYDAMIKRIENTIEHNTHNEYYFNKEY